MYIILQRKTAEDFKELVRGLKNFQEVQKFISELDISNMNDEETRIIYYERKDEMKAIEEKYFN